VTFSVDPVATVGLVTREVRSGARDGSPTKIAIARRTYATSQQDLWDAVTDADRIPRWFLPISGNLEVGGRYQLDGNARGVIERCDEPDSFAVTWEMGPMVSWLEITLTPTDGGTTLELAHEAHVDPDLWGQFGPGAVGVGWDLGLMGLGLHIESGGSQVDRDAGLAFPTTPDGVTFVERAAADWAEAAVTDGDAPDFARTAARRTVAFYTGSPEETPSA
jgi:uncharacterized protein YndB with AHSA1/START domain